MTTTTIPFTEAKSHLSEYARLAGAGQMTLVLKHRQPAFVIAPVPRQMSEARPKHPGAARGRIRMAADFDATPEGILSAFEGQT
jgi:antitoxin (DNA-binding transcriptional repressor) of toxin-antitoxin stability system